MLVCRDDVTAHSPRIYRDSGSFNDEQDTASAPFLPLPPYRDSVPQCRQLAFAQRSRRLGSGDSETEVHLYMYFDTESDILCLIMCSACGCCIGV